MNLATLINKTATELQQCGIKTAFLDVRVLLKYVLETDEAFLITHTDLILTNAQYQSFRRLIRRRKKGEPIAYLVGNQEFYGLNFKVNKHVLIPRPETESLVENALHFLESKALNEKLKDKRSLKIIDVGTGSGCIIISLAKNIPTNYSGFSDFYAIDISPAALRTAKQNAKKHELYNNIRFFKSDLFSNTRLPDNFDLIVANLPYLKKDYPGLEYEPDLALNGGPDGFEIIEKLLRLLPQKLAAGGIALLEVNDFHGPQLNEICRKLGLKAEKIPTIDGWNGIYSVLYRD